MARAVKRFPIIVCLLSGVVLALAFPGANLHWTAWFAISPLIYYTFRLPWKRAPLVGFAFGIGFYGTLLYWIAIFGALPVVLLAAIESLYVIAFVVLAKGIGTRLGSRGRLILLPALWVSLEWLNSLGITAFPWGIVGNSQSGCVDLIQVSNITGVWGISLLIVLMNTALANLATARSQGLRLTLQWIQLAVAGTLITGTWLYGADRLLHFRPWGRTSVAIIQGSVGQGVPHDAEYRASVWETYSRLTREAGRRHPALIVWPEGVVPGIIGRDPALRNKLGDLAASTDAYLLTGGYDEDRRGRTYNCAFLFEPGAGRVQRYAKVHLVPFGEFVPLRDYLPLLARYRVTPYDTSPGREFTVMSAGNCTVGVAICFESIFPQIARQFAESGADLLVVITNDAWFLRTSASEQHLATSVFRAVENDRYLLHAATTGVSAIIDPRGNVISSSRLFEERTLFGRVGASRRETFYTRHGDWLPYLCVIATALMAACMQYYRKFRQ